MKKWIKILGKFIWFVAVYTLKFVWLFIGVMAEATDDPLDNDNERQAAWAKYVSHDFDPVYRPGTELNPDGRR